MTCLISSFDFLILLLLFFDLATIFMYEILLEDESVLVTIEILLQVRVDNRTVYGLLAFLDKVCFLRFVMVWAFTVSFGMASQSFNVFELLTTS